MSPETALPLQPPSAYEANRDIVFMTLPLLALSTYFYGARPAVLCLTAAFTAMLCDHLVAWLRHRPCDKTENSSIPSALVLVLLLLQFGALFSLLRWFGQLLPHYLGGTALVTAAMVIYLLNIDMDNSVRITWLVVIAVLPVLGVPLFWYTKADIGHNALKKRLMDLESQTRAPSCPSRKGWSSVWRRTAPERLRWRATCGGGAAASRCTAIPL